ncbi:MAG TPA: hypothetical protein VKV15_26005 [Bryobacteraceae bacterium]|jgi:hypothetical protein|nr:hypothetical protein [Bryobacteraceae bacterium]
MRFYTNPYNGPEIIFTGKKKNAIQKARKFFRQFKNVAAGFYDDLGVFHPIRASYDYSAKRAHEGGRKQSRKKSRKSRR